MPSMWYILTNSYITIIKYILIFQYVSAISIPVHYHVCGVLPQILMSVQWAMVGVWTCVWTLLAHSSATVPPLAMKWGPT